MITNIFGTHTEGPNPGSSSVEAPRPIDSAIDGVVRGAKKAGKAIVSYLREGSAADREAQARKEFFSESAKYTARAIYETIGYMWEEAPIGATGLPELTERQLELLDMANNILDQVDPDRVLNDTAPLNIAEHELAS